MTTPPAGSASAQLKNIGQRMLGRGDEIVLGMCQAIREKVEAYQRGTLVSEEDLLAMNRAHATLLFEAMGSGRIDPAPARAAGRLRAQQGVPLADVMTAYREGCRHLWEQMAGVLDTAAIAQRDLLLAASELWRYQSEFTDAMAAAYRDLVTEQLIEREQERSALVSGLLDGWLPPHLTAWDATKLLGLPESGHFVVAAASVDIGQPQPQPFHLVKNALTEEGFQSAWCLKLDMQIGVIALPAPDCLPRLKQILGDHSSQRIGVSPSYDKHPPSGAALNYARAALRATTGGERIVIFDTSPYAVAAITDPQTMGRYAELVLGTLSLIDPADRAALLDTFREWVAHDGSVADTARALYCHPNTVRYRLRRLKDHTGRDITRPRDLAELWLAAEAEHRLREPASGEAQ